MVHPWTWNGRKTFLTVIPGRDVCITSSSHCIVSDTWNCEFCSRFYPQYPNHSNSTSASFHNNDFAWWRWTGKAWRYPELIPRILSSVHGGNSWLAYLLVSFASLGYAIIHFVKTPSPMNFPGMPGNLILFFWSAYLIVGRCRFEINYFHQHEIQLVKCGTMSLKLICDRFFVLGVPLFQCLSGAGGGWSNRWHDLWSRPGFQRDRPLF